MISFYKPTPKVTGPAVSFYLNKKDNSFFSNLIKQDSWDNEKKSGSFQKNKNVKGKNISVKWSQLEIASFVDAIDRNVVFSGYHGSNQVIRFEFGPYAPSKTKVNGEWVENTKQQGFSLRVTRESKEDSTDKQSYIIGLTYFEGKLLREHFVYLLKESFSISDKNMEDAFKKKQESGIQQASHAEEVVSTENEDDLW